MNIAVKRPVILALIALALAGALIVKENLDHPRDLQAITLAVSREALSAPVYVAQDRGFFEKEGVRATIQPFNAGLDAMNAVLGRKADFGTAADIPLAFAGLKGEPVLIVATIGDSWNHVKIVARRDRGITRPGDLRGRTIAVRSGTSSEYFLHTFLTYNGMSDRDVRTVDMRLDDMAHALAQGKIDAAVSWNPHMTAQHKALGTKAIVLSNRYVYQLDWNIVTRPDLVKRDPRAVEKMLRALIRATDYIQAHPGEAQAITARGTGRGDIALQDTEFDVHLEQSLLINLESQARWAIRSGLTDRREVPNYLPMVYTRGLEKVRPKAVTMIR